MQYLHIAQIQHNSFNPIISGISESKLIVGGRLAPNPHKSMKEPSEMVRKVILKPIDLSSQILTEILRLKDFVTLRFRLNLT